MKEATGDLNMTLVVVVIVAMLVASFSMYIWPIIKSGLKNEVNCSDAICPKDCTGGTCECKYIVKDEHGNKIDEKSVYCPYKG